MVIILGDILADYAIRIERLEIHPKDLQRVSYLGLGPGGACNVAIMASHLGLPVGALGAVLAVTAIGLPNDVYFKVGLITVIGLAAKNAILIVEFAKDLWEDGYSLRDAAVEAARLRFRPIIMTSMAFMLGVVPLAIATGAGAASQRALGTGVLGGMLSATMLGVIFVPIFFVWVLSLLRTKPQQTDNHPLHKAE